MYKNNHMGMLPCLELGNSKGPVLVLLAGYPDDCLSGWAPIVAQFEGRYRVLAMCFPHLNKEDGTKTKGSGTGSELGWGYSFPELVEMCVCITYRI